VINFESKILWVARGQFFLVLKLDVSTEAVFTDAKFVIYDPEFH
jgi:hypothetical protein